MILLHVPRSKTSTFPAFKDYIALTETFAEGLYTDTCLQKSSSTINPDPLKDLHIQLMEEILR